MTGWDGSAQLPRYVLYAAWGALLSLGAPVGLLLIRLSSYRGVSPTRIGAELAADVLTYAYISLSTATVFTLFGYALGRQADRLAQLSITDALTGLHNARALQEQLRREVIRSARYRQPLSLLLIDLDGLKAINDRLGHDAGDRALRHVAVIIQSQLRLSDLGARWGGDEFALLAPNTGAMAAAALAERVRSLVANDPAGRFVPPVTISIGIATFDPDQEVRVDPVTLMQTADSALYEAKRMGRNRLAIGILTDRTG
jgi:diguanylate cyclase (GGDEF)-like protein